MRTRPAHPPQSPDHPPTRGGGWRRHPRSAALALALCLLAASPLAAGCAHRGHGAAGRAGDCATPGVGADEIRLGLIYPDTGNARSIFAPFRGGVNARLGVANAAGGVRGRTVSYVWADDESDPGVNRVVAESLVAKDVLAVIEGTSAASGSASYLHGQGLPVVGTSLEQPWAEFDNMFSYSNLFATSAAVTTYGDFVAAHGGHSALLVTTELSAASRDFAAALGASLRAAGVAVVGTVDASAPVNYQDLGAEIRDSGADTLVGAVTGSAFGQAVLAARGAQAHIAVALSPAGYDQRMLDTFRQVIAGVYFVVDFLPFEADRPAHRGFLTAMATYAPEIDPANQQAALAGWISADLMLRGLQGAGDCPTRASLTEALRAVHDYTAEGLLTQPVDLRVGAGRVTRCLSFVQASADGKRFAPVEPLPLCGKAIAN